MVCLPLATSAQTAAGDKDSTKNDPQVQVAFRKVAKSDLMGGVSVLDYKNCLRKLQYL